MLRRGRRAAAPSELLQLTDSQLMRTLSDPGEEVLVRQAPQFVQLAPFPVHVGEFEPSAEAVAPSRTASR